MSVYSAILYTDGCIARTAVGDVVADDLHLCRTVLDRFFNRNDLAATVQINDAGATPGTVELRLAQAAEESRS